MCSTWEKGQGEHHATSGSLSLLLDYGPVRYLGANGRSSGSMGNGRCHPSAYIQGHHSPHYIFSFGFLSPRTCKCNYPDQYSGYVVRDLYCLPVSTKRLFVSQVPTFPPQYATHLHLNLDCDWSSSPCDLPALLSRKHLLSSSWNPFSNPVALHIFPLRAPRPIT
jgi:hypothetical protein